VVAVLAASTFIAPTFISDASLFGQGAGEKGAPPGGLKEPSFAQAPKKTGEKKGEKAEEKGDAAKASGARPQQKKAPARKPAEEELQVGPENIPHADRMLDLFDREEAVLYYAGHVEWRYEFRGQPVYLQADRLVLHARRIEEEAVPPSSNARERQGAEAREGGAGLRLGRWRDLRFYADGNVRIEVPSKKTFFEADSLYYEHLSGRGVARGARLKTTFQNARGLYTVFTAQNFRPGPEVPGHPQPGSEAFLLSPLSLHADVLRMNGFELFSGEGVEFSTCDFAVPHEGVRAAKVEVYPEEEPASRGPPERKKQGSALDARSEGDLDDRAFIIDPESSWLELSGYSVAPLPISEWNTRWHNHLPIRTPEMGRSSKFGYFAGADWNLNYFLSLVPPDRFSPIKAIDGSAKLGFETTFLEKRGFAYGPNGEYGTKTYKWEPWQLQLSDWNYYGEAQYFAIHDYGEKDRSTRQEVPESNRFWGHLWHRQAVPYAGLLDFEYSRLSDRAFLGEYFERIFKEEKEQETLVYLRRNILDNLAVTGLYQSRVNDFQTQTEKLPEGKLFLFQQPLFKTGLYGDLDLQAAYLHALTDDALGVPPRGFARYDVLNEWSYPVALSRYFQTRPFAILRHTRYQELLDETAGPEGRSSFGAGVTVSQEWSRIYHFEPTSFASSFLGIPVLKHVIAPKMTYLNIFANDVEPEQLVRIDQTDKVDLQESFALSLRNELYTRQAPAKKSPAKAPLGRPDAKLETIPFETRQLLDSEVSLVLFPQPARDNQGSTSSLMILDNTVSVIPRTSVRAWLELNPDQQFRAERADTSISYEAIPQKLNMTFGDRLTRDRTDFFYAAAYWSLSEKWSVDAYYAHDFETKRDVEYNFELNRIFHRWVLSLEYSLDVGEDRNQTVYVNFSPVELLKQSRHGLKRY
jgi:hypothetical protein